jgi:hypothetical protein
MPQFGYLVAAGLFRDVQRPISSLQQVIRVIGFHEQQQNQECCADIKEPQGSTWVHPTFPIATYFKPAGMSE